MPRRTTASAGQTPPGTTMPLSHPARLTRVNRLPFFSFSPSPSLFLAYATCCTAPCPGDPCWDFQATVTSCTAHEGKHASVACLPAVVTCAVARQADEFCYRSLFGSFYPAVMSA